MIPAVIERCAGIDVGKKFVAVTVLIGPASGEASEQTREFGTKVAELERLRDWLAEQGCTHAVMESTGSYWKPVFNVLENTLKVLLANPQEVKVRKGHKTDRKDSWWLAHLLRHAMITASFIPPRPIRELRDLTRRRTKMLGAATSEKNRIQKILEDANVKLTSVLSDLFGVSGQLMLDALLKGKAKPEQIAQFAQRRAKQKIPEIIAALESHRFDDHHRVMINFCLEHLAFLEAQLIRLDEAIVEKIKEAGYVKQWELIQTVPGLSEASGATVLAEIGPEMNQFGSDKHIGSWGGLCPGNNRSAGKSKPGRTTGGNHWLRSVLVECALVASRMKNCHFKEKYWRIASKNKQKANVAVAHGLLTCIYFVLSRGTPYQEKMNAEAEERQKQRLIRHHIRRLGKLGIRTATCTLPQSGRKARSQAPL
jgi:transposase